MKNNFKKIDKSLRDAVNVDKIKEIYPKYKLAKEYYEKFTTDTCYVRDVINSFHDRGIINADLNDGSIWDREDGTYTYHFTMFIWKTIMLRHCDIDYETYQAFDALSKMKI